MDNYENIFRSLSKNQIEHLEEYTEHLENLNTTKFLDLIEELKEDICCLVTRDLIDKKIPFMKATKILVKLQIILGPLTEKKYE